MPPPLASKPPRVAVARPRHPLAIAAALVWLGASPQASAQAARDFTATTGHVVTMTPVDDLDCRGLARKLAEIDATGYRGQRPRPADRRDRLLFDYEKQVSRRYYSRCITGQAPDAGETARARDVFRKGFQARQGD